MNDADTERLLELFNKLVVNVDNIDTSLPSSDWVDVFREISGHLSDIEERLSEIRDHESEGQGVEGSELYWSEFRDEAASRVLSGIVASSMGASSSYDAEVIAKRAVKFTDALIAELRKKDE